MPQIFHVLRCFSCSTFQVHQVKKSNKWNCKMCGEKQSMTKVFGEGTGAECRQRVQKLNMCRGEKQVEMERAAIEFENQETVQDASQNEVQVAPSESKWEKYQEEEPEEDIPSGGFRDDSSYTTTWGEFAYSGGKRGRGRVGKMGKPYSRRGDNRNPNENSNNWKSKGFGSQPKVQKIEPNPWQTGGNSTGVSGTERHSEPRVGANFQVMKSTMNTCNQTINKPSHSVHRGDNYSGSSASTNIVAHKMTSGTGSPNRRLDDERIPVQNQRNSGGHRLSGIHPNNGEGMKYLTAGGTECNLVKTFMPKPRTSNLGHDGRTEKLSVGGKKEKLAIPTTSKWSKYTEVVANESSDEEEEFNSAPFCNFSVSNNSSQAGSYESNLYASSQENGNISANREQSSKLAEAVSSIGSTKSGSFARPDKETLQQRHEGELSKCGKNSQDLTSKWGKYVEATPQENIDETESQKFGGVTVDSMNNDLPSSTRQLARMENLDVSSQTFVLQSELKSCHNNSRVESDNFSKTLFGNMQDDELDQLLSEDL